MSGKCTANDIKLALAEKHSKDFFLTECKSGSTWMTAKGDLKILDGLAIRKSWTSPCFTGYEVKVSRGDFLRDAKFYTYEELCNCLYVVCPKGMIDRTEVPETVGLMEYDPEKKTLFTRKKAIYRKIDYSPDMLLYIIYSRLDSDRYPFFSSKDEYYRAYIEHKSDSRDLARAVKSRLIEENAQLIKKVKGVEHFVEQQAEYRAIKRVLEDHGIFAWHGKDISEELDKALTKKCPKEVGSVIVQLENCLGRLKRIEQDGGGAGDG